jgi:GxxExxY protein
MKNKYHISPLRSNLTLQGSTVRKQVAMPFIYKELRMNVGYRVDLIVEEKVIIEIKSVEELCAGALHPDTDISETFRP